MKLTESAANKIKELMNKESDALYLRISIKTGGCSGFTYKLDFQKDKSKYDIEMSLNDIKVIMDPKSEMFLKETTLDYQDGLNTARFVYKNKLASKKCSCGISFAV